MIEQCIYEASLSSFFSGCRMSIHSGILIDDGEIIIFEDDIDRQIFCNELHVFDFPFDANFISSIYFLVFREIHPITKYLAFFDHFLEITA